MSFVPTAQLVADLTRREGLRLSVYLDTKGLPTQGIGRHHGVHEGDPDITIETAHAWLAEDLAAADNFARALIGAPYEDMDQVRRECCIDLAFNMGVATFGQFKPFLGFMRTRDYASAALHLGVNLSGHLTPYTIQTGARAIDNIARIAGGIVPEEFRA